MFRSENRHPDGTYSWQGVKTGKQPTVIYPTAYHLVLSCDVQADRLEVSLVGISQNVSHGNKLLDDARDTADLKNICWENLAIK